MTSYSSSRRAFCLSALTLTLLTLVRLCAPAQAQILPDGGHIDPNGTGRQVTPFGGHIDPGGANNLQTASPARPAPSFELLVFLQPGTDARQFAEAHGLVVQYALSGDPDAYVLRAASPQDAFLAHARMAKDRRVRAAYPNRHTQISKFSFTPNDPYFHRDTPAAGWPGEWHLVNEWTPGLDAGVLGAWNRNLTGQGVLIGIVDDCLQTTQPDLAPNYDAADSWDFGQNDPDPDPFYSDDMHGTSVAGVAAARGGNGMGVTGAAPFAGLAGLRCDFTSLFQTDAMFVDATLYHSSGTNTHIKVKNHSYGNSMDYIPAPAQADALATSTAAGTIHCFSAGNGRDFRGEDSNKKEPQCSPDAITVAALGSSGQYATYSSYGANVFVTAPSSSFRYYQDASGNWLSEFGITTTDLTGIYGYCPVLGSDYFPDVDYTSVFGGTSSASPLVAGVMALGKQVQPNLNTRFAKHLLALTSKVVDASDATLTGDGDGVTPGSAWKTNAVGLRFNQNYGFGLIDADAFTRQAAQYSGVTPLQVEDTGLINVGAAIPDNNLTGIKRTFTINSTMPLEEMLLTLNVTHPWRGDVIAYLTSPYGTRARVMSNYWYWDPYPEENDIHWTFCVNTFWGENPQGTWTLQVMDVRTGDVGTLDSFAATARMGTLTAARTNTSVSVPSVTGLNNQTVTLKATLKRTTDGTVLYGGTLSFTVDGALVGSAVTNSSGIASLSYTIPSAMSLGSHTITAVFAGTNLYNASSGTGALNVKAKSTVSVANITGMRGTTVTLSATLRRAMDGVPLYGGTLKFKVDGIVVGSAITDGSGVARLNYLIPTIMSVGTHTITGAFAGTHLYNASSGTASLTAN